MKSRCAILWAVLLGALPLAHSAQAPSPSKPAQPAQTAQTKPASTPAAPAAPQPAKWPREYRKDGNRLVLYQPQIDEWANQLTLQGRAAFQLMPANVKNPLMGTFRFQAKTKTNPSDRTVYAYDWQLNGFRFADTSTPLEMEETAKQLLPQAPMTIALDVVLAYVERGKAKARDIQVSAEPPRIFYSTEPGLLLITQGDPILVDMKDAGIKFVLNANWDVILDPQASQYYLLIKDYWITSASLEGPWSPAAKLPAGLLKLPSEERWARVKQNVPGKGKPPAKLPKVFYNSKPSEMVLFDGPPKFAAIAGTRLRYVANTESDVFFHEGDRFFYYLTAGRWFRSTAPKEGQWELASDKLPHDFAQIPPDHPKGRVLASVKGTREAEDAVLLAAIPQTLTLKKLPPDVKVEYSGEPEFIVVSGAPVAYASNTQYDVFLLDGQYYLCYQAAWFVSTDPKGPWAPAESVPQEIYQIPPESPKHNVTYVTVQESTPSTVTYASTSGYTGTYVSGGIVVLGTGYYYPPYYYWPPGFYYPYYYPYPYYGYGMGAWYNPYTGTYGRGGIVYGPYGGYGQWSAYNPRTGAYGHGAGWYGPYDAGRWGTVYNPRTGTYGARYAYTNYEEAWGGSYVQRGDQWAQTKWYANEDGGVWGARTSEGTGAIAAGNEDHQGFVAKGQDNIYAGKDGNVYKRDQNGNWHHYEQGSGWTQVPQESVDQARQQGQQRIEERTGREMPDAAPAATGQSSRREQQATGAQPGQTRQPSTTAATPGTTRTGQSLGSATGQPRTVNQDVFSGLNRDASARQQGQARTRQYESYRSRTRSSGRVSGTRGRRR